MNSWYLVLYLGAVVYVYAKIIKAHENERGMVELRTVLAAVGLAFLWPVLVLTEALLAVWDWVRTA